MNEYATCHLKHGKELKIEVTVGGVISYICAFTHIRTKSQPTNIEYLSGCQCKLLESLKSQEICCVWAMAPY